MSLLPAAKAGSIVPDAHSQHSCHDSRVPGNHLHGPCAAGAACPHPAGEYALLTTWARPGVHVVVGCKQRVAAEAVQHGGVFAARECLRRQIIGCCAERVLHLRPLLPMCACSS
jgi:hypothetical protein